MADVPTPPSRLTDRLREVVAAREERRRKWDAGEFPPQAYEAVRIALERAESPPPARASDWAKHVEGVVASTALEDDERGAEAIAAAALPGLNATARALRPRSVHRPSPPSERPLPLSVARPVAPRIDVEDLAARWQKATRPPPWRTWAGRTMTFAAGVATPFIVEAIKALAK